MGPNFNAAGNLPRGRWVFSLADAEARFVCDPGFATSTSRRTLWDNLRVAINAIHTLRVRIPSLFIGGTFPTNKTDPGDIDTTFIVDVSRIRQRETWNKLAQYVDNLAAIGLGVQGFIVPWDAEGDERQISRDYLLERGRWDDWWQRDVPKAQRGSPRRAHSLPVRGYIEVEVDGYQ